jgi:hypothetical protein
MKSCCQYHSAIRPNGCNEGRDCPARQQHSREGLFGSRVAVIGFLIFAFCIAGTLEFDDIERAEQASKQSSTKTARAD